MTFRRSPTFGENQHAPADAGPAAVPPPAGAAATPVHHLRSARRALCRFCLQRPGRVSDGFCSDAHAEAYLDLREAAC